MQSLAAVSQENKESGRAFTFFPLLSRQKHLFVVVMVEREEKMLIDKMTKQINAELKAKKGDRKRGKLIWLE